jgi:hypothetical protein
MGSTVLNPPLRSGAPVEVDERAARRALMTQIARLDAELGALQDARAPEPVAARPTPRLLSLAELEDSRDDLVVRIRSAQLAAGERAQRQEQSRRLREEMLLDPVAHRWLRVTNEDIGEPGCLQWHVRPRFGLLGILMRWWRVRISSGCP